MNNLLFVLQRTITSIQLLKFTSFIVVASLEEVPILSLY